MKEIPGYEGLYAVDECGYVWSLVKTKSRRRGRIKSYVNIGGYLRVNLYDSAGVMKKHYVHRLVAQVYLPNPESLPAVNHINADKADNSLPNLEWCDAKYNIAESRKMGLQRDRKVVAVCRATGELREFLSIKDAGVDLFGRRWALFYQAKKSHQFLLGEWDIKVAEA